ncbi:MAG: hypothetical protein RLZZ490_1997 [Cyanobacteriota bacterium]
MKLVRESLLRRYTPPTCTLELWQVQGIWQRQPKVLPPNYQFTLHFDDPRLAEEHQTTLTGTSAHLDALAQTVESYVQTQLSRAFFSQTEAVFPRSAARHVGNETPSTATPDSVSSLAFSLQPQSPFSHQLKVKAGDGLTGPNQAIALTTSQLYDLTTALEQFRLQASATESSQPSPGKWGFWRWSTIALVSMVAIGVMGAMVRQWQPKKTVVDPGIVPIPAKSQFQFQPVMPAIPPAPRPTTASPTLAPTLALRDPLPPPSTVVQASPPPRNPNVAVVLPPERIRPPALTAPPPPGQSQIAIPPALPLTPLVPPDAPRPAAPPSQPNALPILPRQDGQALPYGGNVLTSPRNFPPIPPNPTTAFVAPSPRPLPPRSENLLDTIPQVAEVRQFYQRQWQPTESQTQTLEYRLKISPDGQVQKTVPLGKAASLYLAQLPLPNVGEPLVSPLATDQEETIRLVLTPMGEVKAFLED